MDAVKQEMAVQRGISARFFKKKDVPLLDLKYPLDSVGQKGQDRMTFTVLLQDVVDTLVENSLLNLKSAATKHRP